MQRLVDVRGVHVTELQWLGQFQWESPGLRPRKAGESEQGSLVSVARHQQVLLVARQLHLGANLVHGGCETLRMLVARQFLKGCRGGHAASAASTSAAAAWESR